MTLLLTKTGWSDTSEAIEPPPRSVDGASGGDHPEALLLGGGATTRMWLFRSVDMNTSDTSDDDRPRLLLRKTPPRGRHATRRCFL
jgi:hypothetical protein